jgi:hypothetical protein
MGHNYLKSLFAVGFPGPIDPRPRGAILPVLVQWHRRRRRPIDAIWGLSGTRFCSASCCLRQGLWTKSILALIRERNRDSMAEKERTSAQDWPAEIYGRYGGAGHAGSGPYTLLKRPSRSLPKRRREHRRSGKNARAAAIRPRPGKWRSRCGPRSQGKLIGLASARVWGRPVVDDFKVFAEKTACRGNASKSDPRQQERLR